MIDFSTLRQEHSRQLHNTWDTEKNPIFEIVKSLLHDEHGKNTWAREADKFSSLSAFPDLHSLL